MTEQQTDTWLKVLQIAQNAGAKFPELVAAQWALESAWGNKTSGRNNYFGLKGNGSECVTEEVIDGKRVTITDGFIDFDSLQDCVEYLVNRWYLDWKGYKGVNRAPSAAAAARELVKQGYATDPDYAKKLIQLMKDNKTLNSQKLTAVEEPVTESILFKLEATANTFLKKAPEQASVLGDGQKLFVPVGKGYGVTKHTELPAAAHAKVTLAASAGTWYLWMPHWKQSDQTATTFIREINWNDFECLITPNLTVGEVLQWDRRRTPASGSRVCAQLKRTAVEFQKVRDAWGKRIGVTSFYRPEPINREVGGVPGSRHTTGEAFDVYPVDDSLERFYQWIRVRWSGGLGDGRPRGFIHLDTRDGGHFVPGAGVRPVAEWLY